MIKVILLEYILKINVPFHHINPMQAWCRTQLRDTYKSVYDMQVGISDTTTVKPCYKQPNDKQILFNSNENTV